MSSPTTCTCPTTRTCPTRQHYQPQHSKSFLVFFISILPSYKPTAWPVDMPSISSTLFSQISFLPLNVFTSCLSRLSFLETSINSYLINTYRLVRNVIAEAGSDRCLLRNDRLNRDDGETEKRENQELRASVYYIYMWVRSPTKYAGLRVALGSARKAMLWFLRRLQVIMGVQVWLFSLGIWLQKPLVGYIVVVRCGWALSSVGFWLGRACKQVLFGICRLFSGVPCGCGSSGSSGFVCLLWSAVSIYGLSGWSKDTCLFKVYDD